jgi:hypothetical protein
LVAPTVSEVTLLSPSRGVDPALTVTDIGKTAGKTKNDR